MSLADWRLSALGPQGEGGWRGGSGLPARGRRWREPPQPGACGQAARHRARRLGPSRTTDSACGHCGRHARGPGASSGARPRPSSCSRPSERRALRSSLVWGMGPGVGGTGTEGAEEGSVHLSARGRGPPSRTLETCVPGTAVPEAGRAWPLPTALLLSWRGATAARAGPGPAGVPALSTERAGQGPPASPQHPHLSPPPTPVPTPPPVPVTPHRSLSSQRWVSINHRGRVSSIKGDRSCLAPEAPPPQAQRLHETRPDSPERAPPHEQPGAEADLPWAGGAVSPKWESASGLRTSSAAQRPAAHVSSTGETSVRGPGVQHAWVPTRRGSRRRRRHRPAKTEPGTRGSRLPQTLGSRPRGRSRLSLEATTQRCLLRQPRTPVRCPGAHGLGLVALGRARGTLLCTQV